MLGDEHTDTLNSINNMGFLLRAQGKPDEAEPYLRELLTMSRRVLGDEHPDTLHFITNMGLLLEDQGKPAEAEPYYREALEIAGKLRMSVSGGAKDRASMGGAVNLAWIASQYTGLLVEMNRPAEAVGVLERGRGRSALDLMAGGGSVDMAEAALRALDDPARLSRYEAARAAEDAARTAKFEAEARVPVLIKERRVYQTTTTLNEQDKAAWIAKLDEQIDKARALVFERRRDLAEKTAAVYAELRGLFPAGDPLSTEQILAALAPGDALITWSWSNTGVAALLAHDGTVTGVTLARGAGEVKVLDEKINALRAAVARAPIDASVQLDTDVVAAVRDAVLPGELREQLRGIRTLTAVPDGPLNTLPIELLIDDVPVVYAPSATIAIERRQAAQARLASGSHAPGAIVLGDPDFGTGSSRPGPAYPTTGVVLSLVQAGSNGAVGGLRRGDVMLTYAGHKLKSLADLKPAVEAAAEELQTRGANAGDRPVRATVWRRGKDGRGETIEVRLDPGRIGVRLSRAPPAEALRSMDFFDQSADTQAAKAVATDRIRLFGGSLSSLPGTRAEATAVASLLGSNATLLVGNDASAVRLREAVLATTPRVIHLASHGFVGNTEHPYEACIALTQPKEPSRQDTGFLTLEEMIRQWAGRMNGTELVALSACDTGLGLQQGDTMMALPLGFLAGGAESVLASLWQVPDRATALLMSRFYANWLGQSTAERHVDGVSYSAGEPMPKLAALREAQAWLRSLTREEIDRFRKVDERVIAESVRGDPRPIKGSVKSSSSVRPYAHPYYWAAFVLYGSNQ